MHEFQLINEKFKPLAKGCAAALGLADDVAKFSLKKDEELVTSTDIFVEDIHFLRSDGGFKIASKLLRTNLSDLAAAGAKPLYYMLGFSKNKTSDKKFLDEFTRGLKSVQDEFGLCLIGGDTVSTKQLFFSITIFGIVKKGKTLLRNAAKDGDLIFVSGSIGDAYLGLQSHLKKEKKNEVLNRHFFPIPRIKLGQELLKKNLSNCAIDVSDGLFADLRHLCEESKLAAEIYTNKIPLSVSAKKTLAKNSQITILDLLAGGDDYELIFSINPKNSNKIVTLQKALKLDLTCIGHFTKSTDKKFQITLRDEKNQKIKIEKFGYEH
jgi:thiamine-monophosphate kinase